MTSNATFNSPSSFSERNGTIYYTLYKNDSQYHHSPGANNYIARLTLANNWILAYTSPFFIVLGVFSNLLLIFVLRYPRFRDQSVFLYLRLFFLASLLTLVCDGGVEWMCRVLDVKYLSNISDTICRVWTFVLYTVIHSPSWLVVGLASDRYIYLWHSRKAVDYCTAFVAKIVSALVIIGVMTIAIHALWTFELRREGCYLPIKPGDYHVLIWSWMLVAFIKLIPCITDGLLVVLITIGLCLRRSSDVCRPTNAGVSENETMKIAVVVCSLFFLLTLPMILYDLVEYSNLEHIATDIVWNVRMRLLAAVFKLLLNIAFSLTGVSVIIASASVRFQLTEIIKPFCNRIRTCTRRRPVMYSATSADEALCNNANTIRYVAPCKNQNVVMTTTLL